MTDDLVLVHFNGRAWEWLSKWMSTDAAIHDALSEATKQPWGGRGFRAHVYFTHRQARQVIGQLDEWEDLRKSGNLAKNPTDHDDSLFTRA
jgi:hypothetical protein